MAVDSAPFASIKFGFASAEAERAHAPDLLLQGYYDHQGVIKEAIEGSRFVFLGYKGSGKSAIGQKLALRAEQDPGLRVTNLQLRDFPFNAFAKVGAASSEPETRYPTSWAWLILLRLLGSFAKDNTARESSRFIKSIRILRERGIMLDDDLKSLVVKSSKRSFKAQIPSLVEATHESSTADEEIGFIQLVGHLRSLVRNFRSEKRHLLVIDGLDDVLTQREIQYRSLAALLQEASKINEDLHGAGTPAKIIVLCRTDIFELFPDANKNKIRRDSAVSLDWYQDPREPNVSALANLADLRVRLATQNDKSRLTDYLPRSIDGEPIMKYLLSLTRHTPRDFLQLLDSIKLFSGESTRLTIEQVLSGSRNYSIEYFLPEIKDELVGFASPPEIDAMFSLLSSMRNRDFKYSQLKQFAASSGHAALENLPVDTILTVLYDRSAIGTVHGQRGYDAYTFKFRNRNSTLGFPDRLMLHRGIWKAMNVV